MEIVFSLIGRPNGNAIHHYDLYQQPVVGVINHDHAPSFPLKIVWDQREDGFIWTDRTTIVTTKYQSGYDVITWVGFYRKAYEIGGGRDGGFYGAGVWLLNCSVDAYNLIQHMENLLNNFREVGIDAVTKRFNYNLWEIKDRITQKYPHSLTQNLLELKVILWELDKYSLIHEDLQNMKARENVIINLSNDNPVLASILDFLNWHMAENTRQDNIVLTYDITKGQSQVIAHLTGDWIKKYRNAFSTKKLIIQKPLLINNESTQFGNLYNTVQNTLNGVHRAYKEFLNAKPDFNKTKENVDKLNSIIANLQPRLAIIENRLNDNRRKNVSLNDNFYHKEFVDSDNFFSRYLSKIFTTFIIIIISVYVWVEFYAYTEKTDNHVAQMQSEIARFSSKSDALENQLQSLNSKFEIYTSNYNNAENNTKEQSFHKSNTFVNKMTNNVKTDVAKSINKTNKTDVKSKNKATSGQNSNGQSPTSQNSATQSPPPQNSATQSPTPQNSATQSPTPQNSATQNSHGQE